MGVSIAGSALGGGFRGRACAGEAAARDCLAGQNERGGVAGGRWLLASLAAVWSRSVDRCVPAPMTPTTAAAAAAAALLTSRLAVRPRLAEHTRLRLRRAFGSCGDLRRYATAAPPATAATDALLAGSRLTSDRVALAGSLTAPPALFGRLHQVGRAQPPAGAACRLDERAVHRLLSAAQRGAVTDTRDQPLGPP